MRNVCVLLSAMVIVFSVACVAARSSANAGAVAGSKSPLLPGPKPAGAAGRKFVAVVPVPEPGFVLSALGGLTLIYIARRRNG